MQKKMVKKYLSDKFFTAVNLVDVFIPEHNERVVNLNNAQGLTKTHKFTQSQQIRILHKTNKKTFVVNCWPSGKYVHLLYMYCACLWHC